MLGMHAAVQSPHLTLFEYGTSKQNPSRASRSAKTESYMESSKFKDVTATRSSDSPKTPGPKRGHKKCEFVDSVNPELRSVP